MFIFVLYAKEEKWQYFVLLKYYQRKQKNMMFKIISKN